MLDIGPMEADHLRVNYVFPWVFFFFWCWKKAVWSLVISDLCSLFLRLNYFVSLLFIFFLTLVFNGKFCLIKFFRIESIFLISL